jgi:hypothetical protein
MRAPQTRRIPRLLATLVGTLALGGCTYSIEPVIVAEYATVDLRLVGSWAEDSSTAHATVTRDTGSTFAIEYTSEDGRQGRFQALLGTLGGRAFIEVWPAPPHEEARSAHDEMLLPLHLLFAIEIDSTRLRLALLNSDSVVHALRSGDLAIPHLLSDDDVTLLVGTTAQLRAALPNYVARPGVLEGWAVWSRLPTTTSERSGDS